MTMPKNHFERDVRKRATVFFSKPKDRVSGGTPVSVYLLK